MQVSKRQLSEQFEQEIKGMLSQVIADLPSKDKAHTFLQDFLTETEFIALAKRLAIMMYLNKNRSYEEIKQELKVSSATIASVQNAMEHHADGFNLALEYLKAEEWASKWTDKISSIFGKKAPDKK